MFHGNGQTARQIPENWNRAYAHFSIVLSITVTARAWQMLEQGEEDDEPCDARLTGMRFISCTHESSNGWQGQ